MPGADALRVQVRLSRLTHPELHAALQGLPPRRRADRVRQLALLGLRSLTASTVPVAATELPVAVAEPASDQRRTRLLASLTLAD